MKPVLVCYCDIWKTNSSRGIKGIFNNRKCLDKFIRKALKRNDIEISDGSPIDINHLSDYTISELHNNIDYISLTEMDMNKEF